MVRQLVPPGTAVGSGEWLLAVQPTAAVQESDAPLGGHAPAGYPPGYPPPPPGRPSWPGRTGTAMLAVLGALVLGYGLLGLVDKVDPGRGVFLLLGQAALVVLLAGLTPVARTGGRAWRPAAGAALVVALCWAGWASDTVVRYRPDDRPEYWRLPFDESPTVYQFQQTALILLGTGLVAVALAVRRRRRDEASVDWRSWLGGLLGAVLAGGTTWFAVSSHDGGFGVLSGTDLLAVTLPCLGGAVTGALLVRAVGGPRRSVWPAVAAGLVTAALIAAGADELRDGRWLVVAAAAMAAAGGAGGLGLAARARRTERVAGLPVGSWCALLFAGLVAVNGVLG